MPLLQNKISACQSWGHERHSALEDLCEQLRTLPEIEAKKAIKTAAMCSADIAGKNSLQGAYALYDMDAKYALPGDDCAAFRAGEGYQLLAMEGMLPNFVRSDPRAAGWSSVMANVSDIAAMGGRPTAIVNAFWHNNDEASRELVFHIKRACKAFGLAFAGGHSSVQKEYSPHLAVAISGYAKKLLSCHHLKPGQRLFILSDLSGSWHGELPYWGCVQGKSEEQIQKQWRIPAELAEQDLVVAAKDISNGGVLGTLIMMLELTGCGATVDLNAIPMPDADQIRWLRAFQSFGFLFAVEPEKISALLHYFNDSHLSCAPIGTISDSGKISLDAAGAQVDFWDIKNEPLTHMGEQFNINSSF